MGYSKSSSKREAYRNANLPQETKMHQIDNLTLPLKQLEKQEAKKTSEVSKKKESIKIGAEIKKKK